MARAGRPITTRRGCGMRGRPHRTMPPAQYNLALMYYDGEGGTADHSAARAWHESAARQDYATAQFNLALMYYAGEGGAVDYSVARTWYESAARQGHAPAQLSVALMYYNGEGGPPDVTLAYAWFHAAAEQSEAGAAEYRESLDAASEWPNGTSHTEAQQLADMYYQTYVEPIN